MNINISKTKIVLALSLGFLFQWVVYRQAPGVGFPFLLCSVWASVYFVSAIEKKRVGPGQLMISFFSLVYAGFIPFRCAPELLLLDYFAAIFLFGLFFLSWVVGRDIEDTPLDRFLLFPFASYPVLIMAGANSIQHDHSSSKFFGVPFKKVFVGVAVTLPILAYIFVLMLNADSLFEKWISAAWAFVEARFLEDAIRLFLIMAGFLLMTGAFWWAQKDATKKTDVFVGKDPGRWPFIESISALSLFNLMFIVFSSAQLVFLVGGEKMIQRMGITYSDYSRRGFWQMVLIAVIIVVLVSALEDKLKCASPLQKIVYKLNVMLACLMTGLMMISAFMRLLYYEQAYGFTVLRFYSHTFIVYISVVFLLLAFKVMFECSREMFLFGTFLSALFLGVLWNGINPHAWIAKINLQEASPQKQTDWDYLAQLSEDAIPVILGHIKAHPENKINPAMLGRLVSLYSSPPPRPQSWPSRHFMLMDLSWSLNETLPVAIKSQLDEELELGGVLKWGNHQVSEIK